MISKILEFIKSKQSEMVLALAVILIAIISFESGKISSLRNFNEPLKIVETGVVSQKSLEATSELGQIVASKNSDVYHFSWCSGAQRIKAENKITFASEQEAQSRGYTLASNCKK